MEDQIAQENARNKVKYNDPNFKLKQANYNSFYQNTTNPNESIHEKGGQY